MTLAPPTRRDFLQGALVARAAIGLVLPGVGRRVTGKPKAGKIGDFKISLAEWSLHKALFTKQIDNLDFPKIAREQYGIEGVEFVNQFFKDKAQDSAYLKDLKTRANDHGVTCVLIMIDGEGDLSADGQGRSGTRPSRTTRSGSTPPRRWAATRSGSTPATTTARPTSAPSPRRARRWPSTATQHKINIICENHGGPSSNPDALLALIKAVGKPDFGTLPDFGNFPKDKHGQVHDRHLRRDRPDDALRQGRLGQELRLRRRRPRDARSTSPGS